jgi:cellulose synthase/poly-beta-1,6-N-acetylglucosamine synthase-like glycosyltransferase
MNGPTDATPRLSAVLCTYNRVECLPAALEALLAQDGNIDYEILVIDNNSTDSTASVVGAIADRANGRVRYAFEPRQGLSHETGASSSRARLSSHFPTTTSALPPTGSHRSCARSNAILTPITSAGECFLTGCGRHRHG